MGRGRVLFQRVARRIVAATRALDGVDLVVVGETCVPGAALVLPQRGDDFGARLQAAFADVFAAGYTDVVAVGIDTPELDEADLAAAFDALEDDGAVLGPSLDGGAYLIGMRRDTSSLAALSSVRWCTDHTFDDLVSAIGARHRTRPHADVDDATSARRLAATTRSPALRAWLLLAAAPVVHGRPAPVFVASAAARGPDRIRGPPFAA